MKDTDQYDEEITAHHIRQATKESKARRDAWLFVLELADVIEAVLTMDEGEEISLSNADFNTVVSESPEVHINQVSSSEFEILLKTTSGLPLSVTVAVDLLRPLEI